MDTTKDSNHVILGVHITNRTTHVPRVQQIFTEFGCAIKTRIGLHDVHENFCSPSGMILLELTGDKSQYDKLASALKQVDGVDVQKLEFKH